MGVGIKILIVGVDGFIGSSLSKYLSELDVDVYGTTRRKDRVSNNYFFLDLHSFENTIPVGLTYDGVVFCAGISSTVLCAKEPELCKKINVTNTIRFIDFISGLSNFILFLSSNMVFSGNKQFYKYSDTLSPRNLYGKFKAEVEQYLLKVSSINTSILRLTKVYSKRLDIIEKWESIEKSDKKVISAFTDVFISPVCINIVLEKIALILNQKCTGIFQLGGDAEVSCFDFAKSQLDDNKNTLFELVSCKNNEVNIYNSLESNLPFLEHQYNELNNISSIHVGQMSSSTYLNDPKRLVFILSRYKFVSKMFSGLNKVLEVGCGDAFGSSLVLKEVNKLYACDFDINFINKNKIYHNFKSEIEFFCHDFLDECTLKAFSAIYCLDVLEHIPKSKEKIFISNICNSLSENGVAIFGMPSLESQVYASEASKIGHVNCKTAVDLKKSCELYFNNVFIFSMNDEVLHTGFYPMSNYLFALCVNLKK